MNLASVQMRINTGQAIIVDGLRWRFSAAGQKLLQPEHLRLHEHLANGLASVVKHGLHRTVYHVKLDGFSIFWKHCRINGIGSYLRQWIRPPKARLEFDRSRMLAERGIATIEPLAWGKHWYRHCGPSHLITRELKGGVPLFSALVDQINGANRREITAQLGRYLARLHEAGVLHPDLHPGNILVVRDSAGEPRFHLLDIHNIAIGQPLNMRSSIANLAIFNRWFALRTDRSDRNRFWKSYISARGMNSPCSRAMARTVETDTLTSNRKLWRDRDDRCWGDNRNFQPVRSRMAMGHAVKDIDPGVLRQLLADPDSPFAADGVRMLKESETSTVAEITVPTPTGPRVMIYKRFLLKKALAAPANAVRMSAALRSWQMGHAVHDRGLSTPRPWVVLHRRGRTGPREGYLLCEKVVDAMDVCEFLKTLTGRAKWDAIASLGRTLHHFHQSGLRHRDMKAANLLVTSTNGSIRFHLIDLVGVRFLRDVPTATRARNLSRLNVSFLLNKSFTRSDRVRFLRAYLRWALVGRHGWKAWWRLIDQATRDKVERNRQTGRLIA